jgi:hypothetical protein
LQCSVVLERERGEKSKGEREREYILVLLLLRIYRRASLLQVTSRRRHRRQAYKINTPLSLFIEEEEEKKGEKKRRKKQFSIPFGWNIK